MDSTTSTKPLSRGLQEEKKRLIKSWGKTFKFLGKF